MPAFQVTLKYTALACLSGLAMVKGQTTVESTAFCSARSLTSGSAVMQDAYTEAWLDIGNYVCGSQAVEPVVIDVERQVQDVAFAIAQAFAEVSINCQASGNAEVRATAYGLTTSRAEALGVAVAEIFASADVCGECSATISALSETSQTLISEAVAEAWTEVYAFSDAGTSVDTESTVTSDVIVATVATVLSSISASIRSAANDGCSIEAINEAQVGDFLARCELAVSGGVREIEIDAIASAGADAAAYACNGDTAEVTVDVIARATARALAEAVAQADVFCQANGGPDTTACGLAEVDVRAVASAQAEAFAVAFAAASTCGCDVSASVEASVFDEIWVEAVANAYVDTCAVGSGEEFVTDFTFALEERMLIATARAIADAVAEASEIEGNRCLISADVCANNSEQCKERNQQCGGTSSGLEFVHPCCRPEDRCFRRNAADFRCRNRNSRIPSFWDGTIADCTLNQA